MTHRMMREYMPFRSLGLGPQILKALQEAGYTQPTPIQAAAIPVIKEGTDLIGIAQTGTGKTAAFVLPILAKLNENAGDGAPQRGTKALIIAPTRELVVQIEENIRNYSKYLPHKVAMIYGGVGEKPQKEALQNGVEIIVATPGRLLDLMKQGFGTFRGLQFLVLDEADRMLDMGFIPDIRRIVKALPKQRQTLFFSATLSDEIDHLTHEFLHHPKRVEIGRRSNPADTVTQAVYEVSQAQKPALLQHLLKDSDWNMVLVFTRTKHGADRIARNLEKGGIKAATIHSNRSQNQRLRALDAFKKGEVRVLVATDIAARGIDVDGISHVINYDLPQQPEDYVHRIGRTGRAQATGDAVSFSTADDRGALRLIERLTKRNIPRKTVEGLKLAVAAPSASEAPRGRQQGQRGQGRERSPREGRNPGRERTGRNERGERAERAEAGQGSRGESEPTARRADAASTSSGSRRGSTAPIERPFAKPAPSRPRKPENRNQKPEAVRLNGEARPKHRAHRPGAPGTRSRH